MKALAGGILPSLLLAACAASAVAAVSPELAAERETLLRQLAEIHHLTPEQSARVREIFARSPVIGQGNLAVSRHPATPGECREKVAAAGVVYDDPTSTALCGGPYMAPLYDPRRQRPEGAAVCIDRFEFPDIPCVYPVVWVRAAEAAELCEAVGKRLCDAHEWEGACAGALEPPDYAFELAAGVDPSTAVRRLREVHNRARAVDKQWSYGPDYRTGVCGTGSAKSPECDGGGWSLCGSNTYPAGFFPECVSPLGVYDLNGNAAEHMNLPLARDQMISAGSSRLGVTEMKGSWFVFDRYRAHEDWCRWRAPFWHGSRVLDPDSHHNYHLGFRCCKTLEPRE